MDELVIIMVKRFLVDYDGLRCVSRCSYFVYDFFGIGLIIILTVLEFFVNYSVYSFLSKSGKRIIC